MKINIGFPCPCLIKFLNSMKILWNYHKQLKRGITIALSGFTILTLIKVKPAGV